MARDLKLLATVFSIALLSIAFQNCSNPHVGLPPEPPKSITIQLKDYCPPDGHIFKEIYAYNKSAIFENGNFTPDYDRDGLSDVQERDPAIKNLYDIHLSSPDTNGDKYSDLVTVRMGFDVDNQFRYSTCSSAYSDSDRDGLTDCEEAALGLDQDVPDFDGDGIPDGLEIRFNLNATDPFDANLDLDQDQLSNIEEIKLNTPYKASNEKYIYKFEYKYHTETTFNDDGTSCYNIEVSNIPIMEVTNGNLVQLMLSEQYTDTSQTIAEVITELQTVDVIIDRAVVHDSLIVLKKDNSNKREVIVFDLDNVILPEDRDVANGKD